MRYCGQVEPHKIPSKSFVPLSDQMLVKYIMETESDGGIIYGKEQDTWMADVIRVGPDCKVPAGCRVLMEAYRGDNINLSDGEFTVVSESNALAEVE